MKKISAEEFDELVLQAEGDVFVDFFAEWCGPCRMMEPTLERISEDTTVYQVDIDEERALALKYEIMSIPCVILFRDGEEYKRSVGAVSEKKIRKMQK